MYHRRVAGDMDEAAAKGLTRRIVGELGLTPVGWQVPWRERWGSAAGLDLVRVGPFFFIEEERYLLLSAKLRAALGGDALRVGGLGRSLLAEPIGDYTLSAVLALLNSDVSGRHVIDAGAGEGLLSLVAARLGAASLELIEQDPSALRRAGRNLERNGFSPKGRFRLIEADLKDSLAVAGRLEPCALPAVVLSNIGYWHYKANNVDSILLTSLVPTAELFIGAAYSTRAIGGLGHLRGDEALLGLLGFESGPARVSLDRGRETIVAVALRRGPGADKTRRLRSPEFLRGLQERRRSRAFRLYSVTRAALPLLLAALPVLFYLLFKTLFG